MIPRLKDKLVELVTAIAMLSHPVDPPMLARPLDPYFTWRLRRF